MASSELIVLAGGVSVHSAAWRLALALEQRGFRLAPVPGGRLKVSPPDRLTPEDCDQIRAWKPELLRIVQYCRRDAPRPSPASTVDDPEVAWRVSAMCALARTDPRPVVYARPEAQGGPGRCFSCGDPLEHPTGFGRCPPCDIASDLHYSALDREAPGQGEGR